MRRVVFDKTYLSHTDVINCSCEDRLLANIVSNESRTKWHIFWLSLQLTYVHSGEDLRREVSDIVDQIADKLDELNGVVKERTS